jgi:hypothetical protein
MSTTNHLTGGGSPEAMYNQSPHPENDSMPARGELGIVEKRTWKTWHLVLGMVFAAGLGLAINYHTVGASQSSSGGAGGGAYKLPTPSGSPTTTAASGATASTAPTTTATTATGRKKSTTTTSSPGGTTSSTTTTPSAAATPAHLLLGPTQSQGNWTSPAFTVTAAGWNIGWAFQCTPAPLSGSSFQVTVVPAGTAPTGSPVITETGAAGQAVAPETTTGSQMLVVQAPANCAWAVKVTGS